MKQYQGSITQQKLRAKALACKFNSRTSLKRREEFPERPQKHEEIESAVCVLININSLFYGDNISSLENVDLEVARHAIHT